MQKCDSTAISNLERYNFKYT